MKTEGSFPRWKSVISLWKCQISTRGILTKSHGFCPGGGISQIFPRRAVLPGRRQRQFPFLLGACGMGIKRFRQTPKGERKTDFPITAAGAWFLLGVTPNCTVAVLGSPSVVPTPDQGLIRQREGSYLILPHNCHPVS